MDFNRRNLLALGVATTAGALLTGRAVRAETTATVSRAGASIHYEMHGEIRCMVRLSSSFRGTLSIHPKQMISSTN